MEFSEKLNVTEEQIIQLSTNHPELLDGAVQKTEIIIDAARQQNREVFNTSSFDGFKDDVFTALVNLNKNQPVLSDGTPVNEYISIFKDIFDVAAVRINELQSRWNSPDQWETFTTEEFRSDFKKFFHAREK